MADLTFIIPIGPNHQHLVQRALDSVQAQTVPCNVAALVDTERLGPGVLRNRMLKEAQTEFVAFLDADDWIEPTFAADTIAEYRRIGGNRYVFTDWIDEYGRVVETPCLNGPDGYPISVPDRKPYCGGTWHVLTALIPTDWARAVGGFDESLPGSEDTDFFLKLCTTFRCGHRLARPLFHYAANGGRALAFVQHPDHDKVMREFLTRYGGHMGCCGEQRVALPIGQKQDGDVLAMALWHGNRTEYGRATGRTYPRLSMPKTAWVDPRDVAATPHLWRLIEEPTPVPAPAPVDEPQGGNLQTIAQTGMATVVRTKPNPYVAPINEPPAPPVEAKPDVNRVIRLANQRGGNTDEPIFIFPEKDYPSYADIKRLVSLAGFEARTMKGFDAFSRRPLIVVSPEPPGDLNGLRARVICWQLEYAGDYTGNYKGFTGEVWASDKAWAEAHGAKYVLMGSHTDLALPKQEVLPECDVTMLAYMTPRREAVKNKLGNLRWSINYPGHETQARADLLWATRLMLHVHQHDNAQFVAPQRLALAAAYHMPVVSETTPGLGDLVDYVEQADYDGIPALVTKVLKRKTLAASGEKLHQFLCVERTFRACVLEALKS